MNCPYSISGIAFARLIIPKFSNANLEQLSKDKVRFGAPYTSRN